MGMAEVEGRKIGVNENNYPWVRLSIVMPVFNEAGTVTDICERIRQVRLINGIEKELIIVNDGSSDRTGDAVRRYLKEHPDLRATYLEHTRNRGKGAALHTGIRAATGELLIIQDADMEYDPEEYNALLKPMVGGFADVVYGSRFSGGNAHRILFFWHTLGNRFLTFLSNAFTNLNLSDMETCYKLFRSSIIKSLDLRERHFGFEPEVTAKIARIPAIRIYEVGISYYGRTYGEGKKIHWRDGIKAIYCIFRYNVSRGKGRRPYPSALQARAGYSPGIGEYIREEGERGGQCCFEPTVSCDPAPAPRTAGSFLPGERNKQGAPPVSP